MPTLSRRLQVLVDDERFERLERTAGEREISVGALVREAIDGALDSPGRAARRRAAFDAFVEVAPVDWGTPEHVKELIDDAHAPATPRDTGET